MKLRILSLILAVALSFGTLLTGQIVSAEKMRGDINSDSVVNAKDLLLLRKKIANLVDFSEDQMKQADCNNSGDVGIDDVNAMIAYLVKSGELYIEYENAWKTLYDWEDCADDVKPSEFSGAPAIALTMPISDNSKNPFSKKAVALMVEGLYYESDTTKKGTNPTAMSASQAASYSNAIRIAKSNTSTEIATASNLRVLLNIKPIKDEIAVAYIGFNLKGSMDKYYHRITLENYNDYNYFYFAGKEYTKIGTSRRTYLPDEDVKTITLANEDVKNIRNVYIWYESNQGTRGAPLIIDDIDYYEGDPAFDGSAADDANLPQPEEPVNDGTTKYMAISFDDSPQVYSPTGKHYMDYLMDVAKEFDAKFTFFVIGNNCDSGDVDTLKRALAEGHSIENHSQNHPYLNNMTLADATKQLTDVDNWLQTNVDSSIKTKYLRPPFLNAGSIVYQACQNADIKACIAGPCSEDYNRPSVDYSVLYYIKNLSDGSISLNHENCIEGAETIRRLLAYFSKLGYEFVTIDELFTIKGVTPTLDKMYNKVG